MFILTCFLAKARRSDEENCLLPHVIFCLYLASKSLYTVNKKAVLVAYCVLAPSLK